MLHRIGATIAFCLLTCGLLAGPLAWTAHAEGNAATFIAEGNVAKDGTLKVKQTITLAGAVPPELSQRFETREDLVGDRQYVQQLSDITAMVKDAPVQPKIVSDDRFTTVTIPTNGGSQIVMSYTVTGAVVTIEGGTALAGACCRASVLRSPNSAPPSRFRPSSATSSAPLAARTPPFPATLLRQEPRGHRSRPSAMDHAGRVR